MHCSAALPLVPDFGVSQSGWPGIAVSSDN
ncbi:hypothetical protein SAMN05421505_17013, partial [Sinosporangium album]